VSRAEAAGLVEPQPRSVTHGPPAAQFPVSEVARTASPLVGWPVAGEVSNPFGCTVYYSGIPGPGCPATAPWFHDGLDIAAPAGRPVRAALSGTVIFAGADGAGPGCGDYRGYGLGVVVDTGAGWQALYAHLARLDVVAGQTVTSDTLIGAVGETGCVSGPHLHFGLRYGADLVDPQSVRQK
jgi:murein DD-endopeptidase MepM/ murein hydrolase activator NlpD